MGNTKKYTKRRQLKRTISRRLFDAFYLFPIIVMLGFMILIAYSVHNEYHNITIADLLFILLFAIASLKLRLIRFHRNYHFDTSFGSPIKRVSPYFFVLLIVIFIGAIAVDIFFAARR